jgi:hypothetical protein
MEQLTQFMKSAEKWDRKYLKVAKEAITALSPTEEIAERRIRKYLSEDRLEKLNLANSYSRALFRHHLLLAASELENDLYQAGRVVMMATFVDQSWAFCFENRYDTRRKCLWMATRELKRTMRLARGARRARCPVLTWPDY